MVARQEVRDLVTGEMGYASKNDLGRAITVGDKYPFARDVNNGTCVLFGELPAGTPMGRARFICEKQQ
jgi:hypothetical protein